MPSQAKLTADQANKSHVQRTRRALREGLLALLERKPLDQITNQELASVAQVGYASIFRHYSSKEMLLEEVVQEQISRLLEAAVTEVDAADTHAGCLALCRCVNDNKQVWRVLLRSAPEMLKESLVQLTLEKRPKRNRDQKWVAVELGTRVGVASTLEVIRWWMDHPTSMTAEKAAEVLNRMVVGPALSAS